MWLDNRYMLPFHFQMILRIMSNLWTQLTIWISLLWRMKMITRKLNSSLQVCFLTWKSLMHKRDDYTKLKCLLKTSKLVEVVENSLDFAIAKNYVLNSIPKTKNTLSKVQTAVSEALIECAFKLKKCGKYFFTFRLWKDNMDNKRDSASYSRNHELDHNDKTLARWSKGGSSRHRNNQPLSLLL